MQRRHQKLIRSLLVIVFSSTQLFYISNCQNQICKITGYKQNCKICYQNPQLVQNPDFSSNNTFVSCEFAPYDQQPNQTKIIYTQQTCLQICCSSSQQYFSVKQLLKCEQQRRKFTIYIFIFGIAAIIGHLVLGVALDYMMARHPNILSFLQRNNNLGNNQQVISTQRLALQSANNNNNINNNLNNQDIVNSKIIENNLSQKNETQNNQHYRE